MVVIFRFLFPRLVIVALFLLTASPVAARKNVEYGPAKPLGQGSLRSFVEFKKSGKPKKIGVEFTKAALTGLPSGHSDGTWDIPHPDGSIAWYCCGYEHVLTLPPSAATTPFEHIVVNWNNEGHPPPGIYSVPHFDFHFYLISNEERRAITAPATSAEMCVRAGSLPIPLTCGNLDRALIPLSPGQAPPDFISPGSVEPGMGNHMLDKFAPELSGTPFTQTLLYGTWDGAISFFEPMITLAYLQNLQGKSCYDLKVPQGFAEAGYYPTRYCASHKPKGQGTYQITLDSFNWFDRK